MANGSLAYCRESIDLIIKTIGWGWTETINQSQNRQHKTAYPKLFVQDSFSVVVTTRSIDEKNELAEWVRKWQRYATSVTGGKFSPIRFRYPTRAMDYLVVLTNMPAGGKYDDLAPEVTLNFTIVKDMLDASHYNISHTVRGKWWWESGYEGSMEEGVGSGEVYEAPEPDDAFDGSSPGSGGVSPPPRSDEGGTVRPR